MDRFCDYHQEKGYHTNNCHQLRKQLEAALESGKLNHLIKDVRQRGRGNQRGDGPQQAKIINMIGVRSLKDKKRKAQGYTWMEEPLAIKARLKETQTDLVGCAREATKPLGKIELEVCFGSEGLCRRTTMKFTVIRSPSPYNVILGRTDLKALRVIPSTIHSMIKFPTLRGISTLVTRSIIISKCQRLEKKQVIEEEKESGTKAINVTGEVIINLAFLDQLIIIAGGLPSTCKDQLKLLLKDNMDVFAWEPANMTKVPRNIIEHHLNVNTSVEPEQQKRRVLAPKKSKSVTRDVEEWVKAGIVRPVRYLTWIDNPVLVKKCDGDWSMYIDFKNLNSACPKDFYPLLNIDCKVGSVMGFKYKCFLDAYKGYHQIQMSKEDTEKTTFYTDQGTYYYTKMSFRLKNARATYQCFVDSTFQSQIGRNLKAYIHDCTVEDSSKHSSTSVLYLIT
ncbi:hypothetical protein Tco_0907875 [Tanacetum coccineum]|uniref:Reverse transcriptase domain-containing protein n=1 Tax=Tanacetum coccineum TaxID=301880 RepID=A0ABQ5CKI4_9ASTR